MYSPVCVGPGRKPRRPVFSQRDSYFRGENEPKIARNQDCSRIVFNFASGHTWEIIPCNGEDMADFVICQYSMINGSQLTEQITGRV